jgi:undecaprenyl-diphosphatase
LNLLIALALLMGAFWLFANVTEVVFDEEEPYAVDERILLAMRTPGDTSDPLGPIWVEEAMRDVTAMGSTAVVGFITLSVAAYLAIRRNYQTALLLLLAVAGAYLLSIVLKSAFGRPRPDLVPRATAVFNPSYPSGHSMLSATVYLTLGALLARQEVRRRLKLFVMGLAIFTAAAVGISRIYLGVHWPTDVVAGWTAGAIWAILVWLVDRWLRHRARRKALARARAEELA